MWNKKKSVVCFIPWIHFVLSFFYERTIIHFELDKVIVAAIPLSDSFSYDAERIMGYCIAKVFEILILLFLWNLFFWCIKHWKTERIVRIFFALAILGSIFVTLCYPTLFVHSEDNLITYSYSIRLFPEYWHSAYTSCLLCGLLMVFPHPLFISIFQWIFFLFVIGYVCYRMNHSPRLQGKGKWLLVLIVLIPKTFLLFTDAYRTELYALLCMFYISVLIFDCIDNRKRSTLQILCLMVLSAFLAVWRTEGIVLGLLSFPAVLVLHYKPGKKKACFFIVGLVAFFLLFNVPQKIGDAKYYGKDYSFINSFVTLTNILNSPNANLSYEGVDEDLMALDRITPIEIIKAYSLDGYRRYNVASGRPDINQSMASVENGKAYMKAFYRLVLHNIPIYMKTQISMLTKILGITQFIYKEQADIVVENDLENWTYSAWLDGLNDLVLTRGTLEWCENEVHLKAVEFVSNATEFLASLRSKLKLDTFFLIVLPAFELFMFFKEAWCFLKKKEANLTMMALAFILLGQAAAIVLFMPDSFTVYLHAYYYMTFLLDMAYLLALLGKKESKELL